MAGIRLRKLAHSYRPNPAKPSDYALLPLDLEWEDGKTYALLGPSGCGKTTMLNIISGLLPPSEGQILFDGKDVTGLKTADRNIAQVFQFPVIYSTMTVAQNLAFPLVCRKLPETEIGKRVDHVAGLLGLGDELGRPARKLTADKKQLISLGRGLVRQDVNAILLDEPLTVIDPQMKFDLRRKLKEINRDYGVTMVFVTHDQNEAMTFAQEVVVMDHGRVMQRGSPEELFERPGNVFVGNFIGSPSMNFLDLALEGGNLACPNTTFTRALAGADLAGPFKLGFRAEHVGIGRAGANSFASGVIERVDDLGTERVITLRLSDSQRIKAKLQESIDLKSGDRTEISISNDRLLIYSGGELVK